MLLLSFTVNSFASFTVSASDEVLTFPDLPSTMPTSHYIIMRDDYWKAYSLFVANKWTNTSRFYKCTIGGEYKYISCSGGFTRYFCYYNDPNTWVKYEENCGAINFGNNVSLLKYSTDNIYMALDNDDLLFQVPPLYQIPRITEVAEITKVVVGVLKAIIPIGLVVLSMVLLIFLIKSVISRVA